MNNHISEEEFILEFCGNFGREFGNPDQFFVDNPKEILEFINRCKEEKKPAFLSVQPRKSHHVVLGFEKIFYDFDYADKTWIKKFDKVLNSELDERIQKGLLKQETKEVIFNERKELILSERKKEMIKEVMKFYFRLLDIGLYPLVVKTKKGYHVYLYFDSVYEINNDENFWREVYKYLYNKYLNECGGNYEYVDTTSETDIYRMSRIPFSIHEKTGEKCIIVDEQLRPEKIRGIGNYKNHCLRGEDLKKAVEKTRDMLIKKIQIAKLKEQYENEHPKTYDNESYGNGELRPCFLKALQDGEMCHKMRLALLLEGWYKGRKTKEELIDLFKPTHDFNEGKTTYQVNWFLEHKIYEESEPYKCETIFKENWCLRDSCPYYRRLKGK